MDDEVYSSKLLRLLKQTVDISFPEETISNFQQIEKELQQLQKKISKRCPVSRNGRKDKSWKSKSSTQPRTKIFEKQKISDIQKTINTSLNKLAEDNFSEILLKLQQCLTAQKDHDLLCQSVIAKSLVQPLFSRLYAKLIKELPNNSSAQVYDQTLELLEEHLSSMNYELAIKDAKYHGLCRFLGELYVNQSVDSEQFMPAFDRIADLYLTNLDSYCLADGYHQISHIVHCRIDSSRRQKLRDTVHQIVANSSIPGKIKFMFMDLEDSLTSHTIEAKIS